MAQTSIADLTVEEFKNLIREVVTRTILEVLSDPDEGFELREDMQAKLQHSLATVEAGGKTASIEKVAARLGLRW